MSRPFDFHAASNLSPSHLPVPADNGAVSNEAPRSLAPGDLLADRYELRRELQPGVFLAHDRVAARDVRLVVIPHERVSTIKRALGAVASTGLISIHDVQQTSRVSFYTAEPFDGTTLRADLVRRANTEQRFSVDDVRRLGEQLIDLLEPLEGQATSLRIDFDTVLLGTDGRVRLSELSLIEPDARDSQQQLAALLYELLAGTRPEPGGRTLDQIRSQVPRPLAQAIQRGLDAQRSRRFRSLRAFRQALTRPTANRSRRESLLMISLSAAAVIVVGLVWWGTRPVAPKFTKADYALSLGRVQELQRRADQLDATIISEAKSGRDELDKWQREVNTAREGNKPVQQEYASQRLAEVRPNAELRVQLGDLWQRHQQKTVWQSQASGELTAAQSLAGEGQFDQALDHLKQAESQWTKLTTWKQTAEHVLDMARGIRDEMDRRRPALATVPFAYEWPARQLTTITDTLTATDGAGVLDSLRVVQAALPQIETLVTLRTATQQAVQETETLNDVQEIRQERQELLTQFKRADEQLRRGELESCRTGYEQTTQRLQHLPVRVIQLLVATARKSREAGKVEAALSVLSRALSLPATSADGQAQHAQAHLLRAEIRADQRQDSAAIDDCDQALVLNPQLVAALLLRASLHFRSGHLDLTISDCDAVLQIDAESEPALSQRGIARYRQDDPVGALADFDAALRRNPHSVDALIHRGLLRLDRGEFGPAGEDLRAALEARPQDAVALAGRANVLRLQGDFAGAIRDCDELLRVRPNSADGYLIRGAARLGLKSFDTAIADLQRSSELAPKDTAALIFLAQAWSQKGDWKRAVTVCDAALRRDERCVEAHAERGRANLTGGEAELALADFNRALNIDPQHVTSLAGRAELRFQRNQLAEAMQDYDQALELAPQHVAARVGRAALWLAQANPLRAVDDCDAALQADPKAVLAYRTRAVAHFKLERYEQVIADCTAALKLDATTAEVYAYRGAAWLEQGEADKAIQDCDAALQRNPQLGWCYRTRGKAWFKKGDQTRAQADYEMALRLEPK